MQDERFRGLEYQSGSKEKITRRIGLSCPYVQFYLVLSYLCHKDLDVRLENECVSTKAVTQSGSVLVYGSQVRLFNSNLFYNSLWRICNLKHNKNVNLHSYLYTEAYLSRSITDPL